MLYRIFITVFFYFLISFDNKHKLYQEVHCFGGDINIHITKFNIWMLGISLFIVQAPTHLQLNLIKP